MPIALVCKLYRDVYRETNLAPFQVTDNMRQAMREGRLYLCYQCGTIGEIDSRDLKPAGDLFELAKSESGILDESQIYELPNCLYAKYHQEQNELKLIYEKCHPEVHLIHQNCRKDCD